MHSKEAFTVHIYSSKKIFFKHGNSELCLVLGNSSLIRGCLMYKHTSFLQCCQYFMPANSSLSVESAIYV